MHSVMRNVLANRVTILCCLVAVGVVCCLIEVKYLLYLLNVCCCLCYPKRYFV